MIAKLQVQVLMLIGGVMIVVVMMGVTVVVMVTKTSYLLKWTDICLRHIIIIIIIHSFYIALFSALEQTHCAHWHVILSE